MHNRVSVLEPLRILYVSAELAPFASTGGLGDVTNALPRALRKLGHDVRVAVPCYRGVPVTVRGETHCNCACALGERTIRGTLRLATLPDSDVPLYLVQNDPFFDRPYLYGPNAAEYPDAMVRFCFFSMAVLDGIAKTPWMPQVVHCNDWHTSTIPAYVKTRFAGHRAWANMPTVLTIHNLAYQGQYPAEKLLETGLPWNLFSPDHLEFYGRINLLKAGIAFASKLNAVSPRYAQEIATPENGFGLDGFVRTRAKDLIGILNGIDYDLWNPAGDPHIAAHYSVEDLSGKALCKTSLQKELGLPEADVPLIGMVSRIDWQKGFDLAPAALEMALAENIQVVLLGLGDHNFEKNCTALAKRHPDSMRAILTYDPVFSRRIYAGSDFFLMPSRFEPCGLSQLYALAYGAIPIVRATGGLVDTVCDVSEKGVAQGESTGFLFDGLSAEATAAAVHRAVEFSANKEQLLAVRIAGMKKRFSWDQPAARYVELYKEAIRNP